MTDQPFNGEPDLFGFAPNCSAGCGTKAQDASYPDRPACGATDTSAAAAADLAPHLGRLQQLTLDTITDAGADGCTANELAAITGLPREAIQPRTSELRKKGKIVDSGRRRPNPNGKSAIVWTLPHHRQELP
jgi:hypothetical protein